MLSLSVVQLIALVDECRASSCISATMIARCGRLSPLLSRRTASLTPCSQLGIGAYRSLRMSVTSKAVVTQLRQYSNLPDRRPKSSADLQKSSGSTLKEARENIWTIPNLLTVSRIVSCPFLGYFIVQGNFVYATGLLVYAGVSDWVSHKCESSKSD